MLVAFAAVVPFAWRELNFNGGHGRLLLRSAVLAPKGFSCVEEAFACFSTVAVPWMRRDKQDVSLLYNPLSIRK